MPRPFQIIFLLSVLVGAFLNASTASAQQVKADPIREKNFAYEVKVMNEFIERFNDDQETLLRKYLIKQGKSAKFKRADMIATLFNRPDSWEKNAAAQSFLSQVLDKSSPQALVFKDSNWYAEVICVFQVDGRNIEIPLILNMSLGQDYNAKWMITGIGDSHLFRNAVPKGGAVKPKNINTRALAPSEYATNFLQFHSIFSPSIDPAIYFSPDLLSTDRCKKFVGLIQKGAVNFLYTGVTRFHFFQIPGYIFMVEHFIRPSTNSGWLITDIDRVPASEVVSKKERLLQRSLY